jgi:hypothetical protein
MEETSSPYMVKHNITIVDELHAKQMPLFLALWMSKRADYLFTYSNFRDEY